MYEFTPRDLESGMFGISIQKGKFVVVNDGLVFQNGSYSNIRSWGIDFIERDTGDIIVEVYGDMTCFSQLSDPYKQVFKPLYKRGKKQWTL